MTGSSTKLRSFRGSLLADERLSMVVDRAYCHIQVFRPQVGSIGGQILGTFSIAIFSEIKSLKIKRLIAR